MTTWLTRNSPRGTVIAADVFASGILMSECVFSTEQDEHIANVSPSTDFGQFEKYLDVSGLDVSSTVIW